MNAGSDDRVPGHSGYTRPLVAAWLIRRHPFHTGRWRSVKLHPIRRAEVEKWPSYLDCIAMIECATARSKSAALMAATNLACFHASAIEKRKPTRDA